MVVGVSVDVYTRRSTKILAWKIAIRITWELLFFELCFFPIECLQKCTDTAWKKTRKQENHKIIILFHQICDLPVLLSDNLRSKCTGVLPTHIVTHMNRVLASNHCTIHQIQGTNTNNKKQFIDFYIFSYLLSTLECLGIIVLCYAKCFYVAVSKLVPEDIPAACWTTVDL